MKPVKCVIPVSGGKDSQTCLELALTHFPVESVIGLFCDTQFEYYLTYQHIEWMRQFYRVPIITVTAGDVPGKIRKYQRFPGGGARFCTDELKIVPGKKFYRDLAILQGEGFEVWYGVRHAESREREKRYRNKIGSELYAPHEFIPSKYPKYLHKLGVSIRLPILEWSTAEVVELIGVRANPLYLMGFDRVGCFPCLAGGDKSKKRAFDFDDFGQKQYEQVMVLSKEIGKSVWTSKAMNDQCAICTM